MGCAGAVLDVLLVVFVAAPVVFLGRGRGRAQHEAARRDQQQHLEQHVGGHTFEVLVCSVLF